MFWLLPAHLPALQTPSEALAGASELPNSKKSFLPLWDQPEKAAQQGRASWELGAWWGWQNHDLEQQPCLTVNKQDEQGRYLCVYKTEAFKHKSPSITLFSPAGLFCRSPKQAIESSSVLTTGTARWDWHRSLGPFLLHWQFQHFGVPSHV